MIPVSFVHIHICHQHEVFAPLYCSQVSPALSNRSRSVPVLAHVGACAQMVCKIPFCPSCLDTGAVKPSLSTSNCFESPTTKHVLKYLLRHRGLCRLVVFTCTSCRVAQQLTTLCTSKVVCCTLTQSTPYACHLHRNFQKQDLLTGRLPWIQQSCSNVHVHCMTAMPASHVRVAKEHSFRVLDINC